MGNKISLSLDKREAQGKQVAKLRDQGFLPSIVYGGSMEPISTQSPFVETLKVARTAGRHSPVYLTIDGKKKLAIIKNFDIDPVKNVLRHIEFLAIKQNEAIVTEAPIHLVGEGESEAERAGLVVLQTLESLEIKALPADLPEAINVDIKHLKEIGEKISVADITLPHGVELPFSEGEDPADYIVASVYEPSALQAANESAGGDAEDEVEVESEHGEDAPEDTKEEEAKPGEKDQEEPKQSNFDNNK